MKLPNWVKVGWWVCLSVAMTAYLVSRYPALERGQSVPADIVVFLVWTALLLVPIFQEVEIFGLRFKQQVEKLKEDLRAEIYSVRAELRNAVDVRATFSPQITFPAPPPDSQLPDLEARVRAAVGEALAAHGLRQPTPIPDDFGVGDDVAFLFGIRYALERELRRLARERQLDPAFRRVGALQLSRMLAQTNVIEPSLDNAIREVYAVTSPAIHGEAVSAAQVDFVRRVGPQLVGALRALGGAQ
jgi:hypothetical protein